MENSSSWPEGLLDDPDFIRWCDEQEAQWGS